MEGKIGDVGESVAVDGNLFVVDESGDGEIETDEGSVKYQYEYPKKFSANEILTFDTEEIENYCLK